MKVAFVVGQFPTLSETFVLNQVTGLLDRGVDVDIYASKQPVQTTMHADVERYRLIERTTYSVPEPEQTRVRRARVLRLLLNALIRARGSAARIGHTLRHGRSDANAVLRFAQLSEGGTRHYDVIHCHFGPHGQWGMAMRNMGLLSGKLVTTFHGYDLSRYLRETHPRVYDRLFKEGDLFLPISRFWQDKLIEMGCSPEKIQVHHMGVDCGSFAFSPRELPADGKLRLLSVGRFVEKKGFEPAIRAVAAFARHHPGTHYTIIGDGPLRPQIADLIEELGVSRQVTLAGSKRREEVIQAMNEAHVLLAPSVTSADGNQEGIPVVLMEAMATGLPVLSTRHTGIPELVEDGVTGWLTAERDVQGLTDRLLHLVQQPADYTRIATAGREKTEREFDITQLNDQLVQRFENL